jgi:hypothetical protein
MSQTNITTDNYILIGGLTDDEKDIVIDQSLFIGDSDEPFLQHSVTLTEALDEYISSHIIPSTPPKLRPEYLIEFDFLFDTMISIIEKKRKEIHNLEVIDPSKFPLN